MRKKATESNRVLLSLERALRLPASKLREAFLHSSYVNERPEEGESNERLEFLGDAVIELAISEHLFHAFPFHAEGDLTKIKSVVVSGPVLAERATALNLGAALLLGVGEEESGGRSRRSILADAFEALVGLIFREAGYERAARFVVDQLRAEVEKVERHQRMTDYKSLLQEEAQRRGLRPVYTLLQEEGADHQKVFTVRVEVAGLEGLGRGRRVKEAEQAAAKQVYFKLEGARSEQANRRDD
ncbi:MAG: ribonuclease III [Candidatus Acetothermia bacterium]|nr:ribonuclease III [Candidatus Acetothermia bacterium]MDH7505873.1 ribonuclease III [Candidatus Acetothermia bacterium]